MPTEPGASPAAPDDEREAQRARADFLHEALAGTGSFVWEWHVDSDILIDSDDVLARLGHPPEALGNTQADWTRLIHPDDREANHEAYLRHERGEVQTYEHSYRALAADGSWRWLHERGRIVERHPDGRPRRMLGTQTDITERRALEQQALQAQQDALVAQAASRAKSEFLARMSHELRTPLNAVLGFTQLIASDPADPPSDGQRRRLKLVQEAGEHLLQMIGDLLDLTRIEAGGLALRLEPVALRAAAAEAMAMVRDSAERASVTLALAEGGHEAQVQADRTRLRQVLLNLLSNAIKYNRAGGRVDVAVLQSADGSVRLQVRDTGIGIAAADLPRLFDPFYRGPQPAGSSIDGAGIGLAVTQSLVLLLGGRIEAQSTPGAGSTFSVVLPGSTA